MTKYGIRKTQSIILLGTKKLIKLDYFFSYGLNNLLQNYQLNDPGLMS